MDMTGVENIKEKDLQAIADDLRPSGKFVFTSSEEDPDIPVWNENDLIAASEEAHKKQSSLQERFKALFKQDSDGLYHKVAQRVKKDAKKQNNSSFFA